MIYTLIYIPSTPTPREQWRFKGRETHYGSKYLIWIREDGKQWARCIK